MKKKIFLILCFFYGVAAIAQEDSDLIMSRGGLTVRELTTFFIKNNPEGDAKRACRLAKLYIAEAAMEGVNHDIAFAQMILETGWLRFEGLVTPDMNNFCGIGATGKNIGHHFNTEREGVRAHIQHLKAYGSRDSLNNPQIDPRYNHVSPRGKSPTLKGLSGTWAADMLYASKIKSLLQRMYQ